MIRVMPQIAAAAKFARERRNVKRHQVSRYTDKGDDALRKFEEGGQAEQIDRYVNAYAAACGISVFDLWDEAIREARKSAKAQAERARPAADDDEPPDHDLGDLAEWAEGGDRQSGGEDQGV